MARRGPTIAHHVSTNRINARLRLALRAEKAFGLTSLPIVLDRAAPTPAPGTPPAPAGILRAAPVPPRPMPQPVAPQPAVPTIAPAPQAVMFEMPTEPFTSAVMAREDKIVALQTLNDAEVKGCRKCRLCQTRTQTVFGEGDPEAHLMFIGEGPGENEDLQGRPFVGKAGQLLDRMIQAMGLSREKVYICNIVKCRPPNNRQPAPDETAACTPYLLQQIEIVRPKVIVTLGLPATQFILQTKNSMGKMRGRWHEWRGIKVMPTYHPAYVLRDYTPRTRAAVWDDLQQVLAALGLPVPKRRSQ